MVEIVEIKEGDKPLRDEKQKVGKKDWEEFSEKELLISIAKSSSRTAKNVAFYFWTGYIIVLFWTYLFMWSLMQVQII